MLNTTANSAHFNQNWAELSLKGVKNLNKNFVNHKYFGDLISQMYQL